MSAMATTQTSTMTYEQFRALPDSDEYRHTELIDGVLVHKFAQRHLAAFVVNAPSRLHQRAVLSLTSALVRWTRRAASRGEATHGVEVAINDRNAYVPDVAWFSQDRRPPEGEEFQGPPALAVEVLSPSTRAHDRRQKAANYARAGVDELWLVDTKVLVAKVFRRPRPDAIEFALMAELGADDELTSPLMPGFALRLDALLQR